MILVKKEKIEAYENDEVPVGAVVVQNGKVISSAHNMKEECQCSLNHAELIAIKNACGKINNWRLIDSVMYVTLEPCPMCSGAIINSRIPEVYYGASDPKAGTVGTLMNLLEDSKVTTHLH